MNAWVAILLLATTQAPALAMLAHGVGAHDRYSTAAYDREADAQAELKAKLERAAVSGKKLVVIMGANWCHDSAALANLLASPRFAAMVAQNYELLFVDIGTPLSGKARNLDIARRFGVKRIKGTPMVFILSPDGKLLNSRRDATRWRNAASRKEDKIYRYFAEFTGIMYQLQEQ